MKNRFVIGIDVGGTNVKLGLVTKEGRIKAKSNLSTKTYRRSPQKLIRAISDAVNGLLKANRLSKKNILGIGVGLPGLINPKKGLVIFLPNIPGWRNIPLKKILQKHLGIPVFIDNDLKLITLGEWKYGAGRGEKNLVCMTLGTGIGSGLVFNNRLYRGAGFAAGELGHVPLNEDGPRCNCGGWGCFERYVGNRYLLERLKVMFKRPMAIEEAFLLANRGDKRAIQFFKETAEHIGNGLISVVNLLNPRLIVIGGGVSNNQKFLFKTIDRVIKKRAMSVPAKMVKIKRAQLGDVAGIVGASVLVREAS